MFLGGLLIPNKQKPARSRRASRSIYLNEFKMQLKRQLQRTIQG